MVDIGLKIFYQHQPYPGGLPLGQGHGLRIFIKSENFCVNTPRHTKYVGVFSFRFSIRSSFVRSFVRLSVTGSKFLR